MLDFLALDPFTLAAESKFLDGKLEAPQEVETPDAGKVMYFPRLYRFDNKGKVREWHMETQGAKHRTITGIYAGKLVESGWTVTTAKNHGKKNAVTAEDQAFNEVEGLYKKKLKQNWTDAIPNASEAKASRYFQPMLAERYKDLKAPLNFPVDSQPKLDGFRCIARADGLWTRKGEKYASVPHIEEALKPFFEVYPFAVLDGELYNHELRDDFNEISSILRKQKAQPEFFEKSAAFIQYHIYDALSIYDDPMPFRDRMAYNVGHKVGGMFGIDHPVIKLVATFTAGSQEALDAQYVQFREAGYEGQMIRLDGPYQQDTRSKFLIKRKEFEDDEFEIVAVNPGLGNWSGRAKSLVLRLNDGKVASDGTDTFGAGMKGSQKFLEEVLANADYYIGKKATIRYDGYTPSGKPRFGTCQELDPQDK